MKKVTLIIFLSSVYSLFAQPNTNIYLYDIVEKNGVITFENMQEIANTNGYENQPSFYDNNTLLFSATRNGQTDIAKYNINSRSYEWVTNTPGGSEYSPLRIPESEDISAVRLDTTGLQRLYRYYKTGQDSVLLEKLKVGYHVWDTDEQLMTAVLVKGKMNLMMNYLPEKKNSTVDMQVGRSMHKIPKTKLISYISNAGGAEIVSSYDPLTNEIDDIINLPASAQDMCWYDEKVAFVPVKNTIAKATAKKIGLTAIQTFKEKEIYNITRMAVSPNQKYLALVTDENPEILLDQQVSFFNARNLENFASCFTDSVTVSNFPNDSLYSGRHNLKEGYANFFEKNESPIKAEVLKRFMISDIVIDQERITKDGKSYEQAAIYEIDRGLISSMSFIQDNSPTDPRNEVTLKDQLEVYNFRNISGYASYFIDNIEIIDYADGLHLSGKEAVVKYYGEFFEKAKELEKEVINRMVIGNTIIDEELVTIGTGKFRSVVVYEMSNGLVKRVSIFK